MDGAHECDYGFLVIFGPLRRGEYAPDTVDYPDIISEDLEALKKSGNEESQWCDAERNTYFINLFLRTYLLRRPEEAYGYLSSLKVVVGSDSPEDKLPLTTLEKSLRTKAPSILQDPKWQRFRVMNPDI